MEKENLNINTTNGSEASPAEIKKLKKAEKKRKKFEKKELKRLKKEYERKRSIIPTVKRPIICPPDCSDVTRARIILGMVLRVLVILVAVIGISLFVTEAFGFDMTPEYLKQKEVENYGGVAAGAGFGFIVPWAILFVGALSLCCLWKYGKFIGIPVIIASAVILTLPDPVRYLYEMALTVYNGALGHMKFMGFFAIDLNQVAASQTAATPEELVRTAVILFTLVCALVFVPATVKRARIILPGAFTTGIMVFIFVYNLSRSNLAAALIIASFAGLIVMYIYDRIFIVTPKPDETDDCGDIFGASAGPALPERLLSKRAKKEEKRAAKIAKKNAKKARKQAPRVTVEEEITDYFADTKPAKQKKVKLTPEQKKEAKAAKKEAKAQKKEQRAEDKRAIAAYRKHHFSVLVRRSAIGGFAGGFVLIVALAVVAFPALTTKGSFETIPAIDEKLDYYREYITALLMGDDPSLDLLAFEGDTNNFSPRDTTATPRYYTYEPLITVESNYASNIYLRGWIGTDYIDGAWHTADPKSETLAAYRDLFATNDDASESIYYNFFRIMTDDGLYAADKDVTESIKRLEKYGYTIAQVNMRRTEEFDDKILYMPSFHIRAYSPSGFSSTGNAVNYLRMYGSSEPSEISYANYFDGLYTSYRASLQGIDGYAAVAMIPTMKNDSLHYNLANLIAEYNQTRLAIANGRTELEKNAEDERLGKFSVTLYNGTVIEYTVVSVADDGTKTITISQEKGTALYTILPDGDVKREMIDTPVEIDPETGEQVTFYAPSLDLSIIYFEGLDSTEKWHFNRQAEMLDKYTPFVYNTYTKRAGSKIVTEIYNEIIANAVVEEDYKDPVPADFSKAALKNEYLYNKKKETYEFLSAVTDRDVYVQRHELVMEIINYLCAEERYTYTLEPTVLGEENTLDGIETFLTKTREGYCVQFASSLVLLLREAGIPARYVEGYIATGMRSNRGDDAVSRYTTTVRDNNAHAWVEVWYDGIGWIQYEATPEYYDAMYVTTRTDTSTVRPPSSDNTEDPEEEPDVPSLTEEEIKKMLEEQRKEALKALIKKIIIIASVTLAAVTVIAVFFAIVLKRAKKSAKEREDMLREMLAVNEKSETLPDRTKVRRLGEMIMNLLAECGYKPENGEFSGDFAARIAVECERELVVAASEEGLSEFEAPRHPLREEHLIRIFEAIAAEEFGSGAPANEMPQMAKLYCRLHATLYKRRVNYFRRAVLYLFKRES